MNWLKKLKLLIQTNKILKKRLKMLIKSTGFTLKDFLFEAVKLQL